MKKNSTLDISSFFFYYSYIVRISAVEIDIKYVKKHPQKHSFRKIYIVKTQNSADIATDKKPNDSKIELAKLLIQ